jgi:probable rRNA maturation factor
VVIDEQGDDERRPVDVVRWTTLVDGLLDHEGVPATAEISVMFVDEDAIAELNAAHMGGSGPTDVLSFPIDGDIEDAGTDLPTLLGDVVICPAVASRNAPEHAGAYDDEVALLIVHGVLHLLGLDHADDDQREAMQRRERELLDRFYGPLARDPWA